MKKHPIYLRASRVAMLSFVIAAGLFGRADRVQAGDWPQILGPQRNGVASGEKLQTEWPASGPKRLWAKSIGQGYASAVVAGENIIVFHRVGKEELVESLSLDGKTRWKQKFPAYYRGGFNTDQGPRCTPVIDGDDVFAYGAGGDLYCVSLADGKVRWTRALAQDYKAPDGYFGAGSAPIVVGDHVLVNVGGNGAGIVAVNRRTGKTAWKRFDDRGSYSAPTLIPDGTEKAVLFVTRLHAVAVNPKSGAERFRFRFGKPGTTVNAATPLYENGTIFLTASYGIGAELYRLTKTEPKRVWGNDSSLSSQYVTPVFYQNHLYGSHGREDFGGEELRCVVAGTGKVKWSQRGDASHVIRVGDLLLVQSVKGRLDLVQANSEKYKRLASAEITSKETKAIPALANGRLYIRANDGENSQLICIEVGAR